MTAAERVAALAQIGWTSEELGRRVRYHPGSVRRWLQRDDAVPPAWLDPWLAEVAGWIAAHPAPQPEGHRPVGRPRKQAQQVAP